MRLLLMTSVVACAFAVGCMGRAPASPAESENWAGRMADSVMARSPDGLSIERNSNRWSYSTSFAVHAIARLGALSGDERYTDYARRYMDHFINDRGEIATASYDPEKFRLDDVAPGRLLLLLHRRTGNPRYRAAADALAAQLRRQPRTSDGGFWHKQIYPHQMWLDGIYMACPFMVEYGAATQDSAWHDEAARQIITIAGHTRDPRTGLHFHGWDESRQQEWADPQTGLSPCIWGRAVGWFAVGIIDTLETLPADHPHRPQVIEIFRNLSSAIAGVQDPESGVWYQVLDQPDRDGNYLESSASCMFVYALRKGVRLGLLDRKYDAVARRAFEGVIKRFVRADPATGHLTLTDTCAVAGLGGKDRRDGSFEYYMSEPRVENDPKGLAPFILASMEMASRLD